MRKILCWLGRRSLARLRRLLNRCEERPVPQYGSLIQFHARTILLMACRARNRAIKSHADRTGAGEVGVLTDDAIAAIVMAAAAAEAFINELADNIGLSQAKRLSLDAIGTHCACGERRDPRCRIP